ncbi:Uncharacterised protein [Klebsiella michiganensis]|nr:Uncharacterised protein [Klebsiella michiganensis]
MPLFFTGGRVKREQALVSGTQIKRVAHFNRRDFIGDFTRIVRLLEIARTEDPGFFQVLHVIGVDLLQRRVALAFLIAAIRRPVAIGYVGNGGRWRCISAQRTVDFLRVVEAGPGQDTAANQQGDNQPGNGARGGNRQAAPDKRQDKPDAEEDQNVATRGQRPEVETNFPYSPDHSGKQQRGVQPKRRTLAAEQHDGDAQHDQACDRVVP